MALFTSGVGGNRTLDKWNYDCDASPFFGFWLLNIGGEEFFWRGVLLPRQEKTFEDKTWILHGTGWAIFHIAFGWQLLVMLLPLLYIEPYVVQKTQNTWTGVFLHGVINGPSFIAIALGII